MIITDFSYNGRKKPLFIKYYFYDLDKRQSLGPAGFNWQEYFVSKESMTEQIIAAKRAKLESAGLLEKGTVHTVKDSRNKFSMHLRGISMGELRKCGFGKDFINLGAMDMAKRRWDFTRTQIRGLDSILGKQKQAHNLFREVHDEIRFPMLMEGATPAPIRKALKKTGQIKEIEAIQTGLDAEVKSLDPQNYANFDINTGLMFLFFNSSNGLKVDYDPDLPAKIKEILLSDRGLLVDDIETGDYTTEHPFIYLDWFCWKENNRFPGQGFGFDPIVNPVLADGVVYDGSAANQDEIRKLSSRFFFDFDPLAQGGHNNLSFDNQKRLNPLRKAEKGEKRAKGDGKYLVRPDNSEIAFSRDKAISEIMKPPGIVTDSYRFCDVQFKEFFPNTKLETVIAFFKKFIPGFDFSFKKSLGSYSLIETKRIKWNAGSKEDGQDIVDYGYWDVVAHYMANITIAPWIINIADCCNMDIFSAGVYFPKDYGVRFWDQHYHKKFNRSKFWAKKLDNSYKSARDDSLVELIARANVFDSKENKIRDVKRRTAEKILNDEEIEIERKKGYYNNVSVFHLPSFALGMEWYFQKDEFERLHRLYDLMRNAESPLEAMVYGNVLDSIAYVPLFETKQVQRDDKYPSQFKKVFDVSPWSMLERFSKELREKFKILKDKKVIGHTGDLLVVKDLDWNDLRDLKKEFTYMGQADVIRIKEMQKTGRGKGISEKLIFNYDGLVSSRGIEIPTLKKVENAGHGDSKTVLETRTQYNFLTLVFEDKRKALEYIADVAQKLGDFDPIDYICTQTLRRDIKEYQWKDGIPKEKRIQILNYLGAQAKDEEKSYAVGTFGKDDATFVEFKIDEQEEFREYFTPRVEYYRRLLFGNQSLIFKTASSIFMPKAENDEGFEERINAYNNIILGNGQDHDIDVLLEPLD